MDMELPIELIFMILQYLSYNDLYNISKTNRFFRNFVKSFEWNLEIKIARARIRDIMSIIRSPFIQFYGTDIDSINQIINNNKCKKVVIRYTKITKKIEANLEKLILWKTSVDNLSIFSNCCRVELNETKINCNSVQTLESVKFLTIKYSCNNEIFSYLKFPNLIKVVLADCVTDNRLRMFLANNPTIETLVLICNNISNNSIRFLTELAPNLKNLIIHEDIDNNSIEYLNCLTNLKYLDISDTKITNIKAIDLDHTTLKFKIN